MTFVLTKYDSKLEMNNDEAYKGYTIIRSYNEIRVYTMLLNRYFPRIIQNTDKIYHKIP
jgi:hypothetical protein